MKLQGYCCTNLDVELTPERADFYNEPISEVLENIIEVEVHITYLASNYVGAFFDANAECWYPSENDDLEILAVHELLPNGKWLDIRSELDDRQLDYLMTKIEGGY